ncbi:MAG: glutaredoxin family protein [Gammaproteobacteria bacterium]|nr:MAG: glutaredoxin family protein [Gammaproteobacteria bacterium]TLZ37564.1 MAG: glutaredoxin family protein [Gammaproteobacteria bacterium]TLZ42751.1 MAG: glutaredoxin family protein [Gammaproteobacteria bacterium]
MPAPRLTVVHRRDCALCEEMLAELDKLGRSIALPPVDVVDVDADPLLRRRHGLDVPVLLVDDTVVCRHRLDPGELARALRQPPGAGG